jgi:hypothetical protein
MVNVHAPPAFAQGNVIPVKVAVYVPELTVVPVNCGKTKPAEANAYVFAGTKSEFPPIPLNKVVVPHGPVNVAVKSLRLPCVAEKVIERFDAAVKAPGPRLIDVLPPAGVLFGIAADVLFDPERLVEIVPPELVAVNVELAPRHIGLSDATNETTGG